MTNAKGKMVNLPASLFATLEQRGIQFVNELSDIRQALEVFVGDTSQESRVACLNLIDRELKRIQQEVDDNLRRLPDCLTDQI